MIQGMLHSKLKIRKIRKESSGRSKRGLGKNKRRRMKLKGKRKLINFRKKKMKRTEQGWLRS